MLCSRIVYHEISGLEAILVVTDSKLLFELIPSFCFQALGYVTCHAADELHSICHNRVLSGHLGAPCTVDLLL